MDTALAWSRTFYWWIFIWTWFPLYFSHRETRDRYQAPQNPQIYFTELGRRRLEAKGIDAPEPLDLELHLQWRPLWRRERRWIAYVAPGTIAALYDGVVGIGIDQLPPPRTVVVLEEWRQWGPKKPRGPRGGNRVPSAVKLPTFPVFRPGFA